MILDIVGTKYAIHGTNNFKKQFKKVNKQGKDIKKFRELLLKLANGEKLDVKYRDHALNDNKQYQNCRECHIEPDWLLIYQYQDNELIILLMDTGSHSNLF